MKNDMDDMNYYFLIRWQTKTYVNLLNSGQEGSTQNVSGHEVSKIYTIEYQFFWYKFCLMLSSLETMGGSVLDRI